MPPDRSRHHFCFVEAVWSSWMELGRPVEITAGHAERDKRPPGRQQRFLRFLLEWRA